MALHAARPHRFARNLVAVVGDAHRGAVQHLARNPDHHVFGCDQLLVVYRNRAAVARFAPLDNFLKHACHI